MDVELDLNAALDIPARPPSNNDRIDASMEPAEFAEPVEPLPAETNASEDAVVLELTEGEGECCVCGRSFEVHLKF